MSISWYEIIKSPADLNQGDLIKSCPVIIPPAIITLGKPLNVRIIEHDIVVLSQSCDLVQRKLDKVMVCATISLREFIAQLPKEEQSKKSIESFFSKAKAGLQPNYHIFNKDDDKGLLDYTIVNFRDVFSVDFNYLTGYANSTSNRVRLLSPYKEQLSQAFAKFFMRVGLPQDIGNIDGRDYVPTRP